MNEYEIWISYKEGDRGTQLVYFNKDIYINYASVCFIRALDKVLSNFKCDRVSQYTYSQLSHEIRAVIDKWLNYGWATLDRGKASESCLALHGDPCFKELKEFREDIRASRIKWVSIDSYFDLNIRSFCRQ